MMKESWTGGRIQPIFARVNRAATRYAQHNIILREDDKVDIVVKVIEDIGLLAADYRECIKKDEIYKTWTILHAYFKKAKKDLKFQQSTRSGGFANAVQQTANFFTETIEHQSAARD